MQQVEEGKAEGKRSPERDRLGESYRGKERETQTRATMLPAAQAHSMSVFSLASGLESRGGTDRTSIGRLLVPSLVTLYHEAQRRKSTAQRALGVEPGCQCVSEIFDNR